MVLVGFEWGLEFDIVGDLTCSGLVEEGLGIEVVRQDYVVLGEHLV